MVDSRSLVLQRLMCPSCQGSFSDEGRHLRCRTCGRTLTFDDHGILLAASVDRRSLTTAQRLGQLTWAARWYESWRKRSLSLLSGERFTAEREWHILFGELPFGGTRVYLDNATATGFLGRALARRLVTTVMPFVVIANDLSLPMLRRAVQMARRDGIADRMFFIHASSESLPLRPGSVDGIMCGGTLNEFADPDLVLRAWSRLLTPGGSVTVMLQSLAADWRGWLQRRLGTWLGLRIESADNAIARFDSIFQRRRRLNVGPVLFLSGHGRDKSSDFRSRAA